MPTGFCAIKCLLNRKTRTKNLRPEANSGQINETEDTPLFTDIPPYILAMTAAFMFATGGQFQNIGLKTLDSRTATMIAIGTSGFVFWLMAPWWLDVSYFSHPAVLIFAAIGLIRPAISANLSVAAIKHLGPTLTMTLAATSPLFGATFGILILNEMLTAQIAIGTVGIVMAVIILTRRKRGVPATWPAWALMLPIGAALIRATAHLFIKIGLEYIPDPYFVGLVGSTVAFIATGTLWRVNPNRTEISFKNPGVLWFLAAGTTFAGAIISLNTALFKGDIVTVVPLIATSPIFSMLMSVFIFRREKITWQIVVAILIVMPSMVLVALSR